MENLTHRELQIFSEFLRALYAVRDKQSFVTHLVASLSTLLSAEVCSYNEIDPVAQTAWYTYSPSDYEVIKDGMAILGRYADQCPLVGHMQSSAGGEARRMSDFLSMAQLQRLDIHHEFYKPMKIPYTLATSLSIAHESVIALGLHRERRDFSEQDRLLLDLLQPHLVQASRNAQIVSRMKQETVARDCALDHLNMGIVGVTAKGKIQWVTQTGWQLMQRYFPPRPRKNGYLPETLMDWMRRNETLSSDPTHISVPHPMLTIQHGERSLRIRFVPEDSGGLLFLEECCERFPHEEVLALGLTPREAEVLSWLVQGKTSIEIGKILGASPRTIQKHVERIFDKLGVENRVAAVAIVHELRRTTFQGR